MDATYSCGVYMHVDGTSWMGSVSSYLRHTRMMPPHILVGLAILSRARPHLKGRSKTRIFSGNVDTYFYASIFVHWPSLVMVFRRYGPLTNDSERRIPVALSGCLKSAHNII